MNYNFNVEKAIQLGVLESIVHDYLIKMSKDVLIFSESNLDELFPFMNGVEFFDCLNNLEKYDLININVKSTTRDIDSEAIVYVKMISEKSTFTYIMKDSHSGYYKIGKSKNPKVRESTLFSEKPCIDLLFYFKSDSSCEKWLHLIFHDKRVRGEWFDLTESDIQFIKQKYLS